MATYVTGLLLDGERKSIEPIATRLVDDPAETDWAQVETLDDTTLEQRLYGPRVYLRLPGASEMGLRRRGVVSLSGRGALAQARRGHLESGAFAAPTRAASSTRTRTTNAIPGQRRPDTHRE